jgi:two-component system chemotaxis response regulator CheY
MSVLIMDPNEDTREMLSHRLEAMDFEVVTAAKASEAKSVAGDGDIELVFTEWESEGLVGPALIKTLEPDKHPVVVITELDPSSLQGWKEAGAKVVLHKTWLSDILKCLFAVTEVEKAGVPKVGDPALLAGKGVMVIEDSATMRGVLKRTLAGGLPGCTVWEAEDAKVALTILDKADIRLVVTDLNMPGMDGNAFIQNYHARDGGNKKPVLVLSGNITGELFKRYGSQPYIKLLPKPCSPQEILGTLQSLLAYL